MDEEDRGREVYLGLKKMGFRWFKVECTNFESIHFHDAYACAEFSGESENNEQSMKSCDCENCGEESL